MEEISKEEVEDRDPTAEVHGEVLSREYLTEESKVEFNYYYIKQKLHESTNIVNTYLVSGPPTME